MGVQHLGGAFLKLKRSSFGCLTAWLLFDLCRFVGSYEPNVHDRGTENKNVLRFAEFET